MVAACSSRSSATRYAANAELSSRLAARIHLPYAARTAAHSRRHAAYAATTASISARRRPARVNDLSFITSRSPFNGSRGVSERMPKGVRGSHLRHAKGNVARGSHVLYDDLGHSGLPVPLKRDRQTIRLSCIKLNKHDELQW
jgi:hypothetical protein